ncbi:MAG TPA: TlyA family RNA methyltransferase [Burkholderiales bacterium]|nr:TlyA family RNA methyltransferase [Burkholderiales bacterium]
MKERADKLLVARGLAPSREKAQALIMAGVVSSGGQVVTKPGSLVDEAAAIALKETLPFVSRGGLKLAEALDRFAVDVRGKTAVDVGSSTGGFTDCLLQRGARRVYAVDVDTAQLDWKLRGDPRVVLIEKNARYLQPSDIPEPVGLIAVDVSFISLLKVLDALRGLAGDGLVLALVKPQFEAGRREVGKKGIVRDPAVHEAVLRRVTAGAREAGFALRGLIRCSTRGQKGNVEFLGCFARTGPDVGRDREEAWIKEAVKNEDH